MRWWTLVICIPALVVVVGELRKKRWYASGFPAMVLVAGGFVALIGLYQIKKLHHFDYYFYKTMFTVLFVAVLFYGYLAMRLLADNLSSKRLPAVSMMASSAGTAAVLLMLVVFNLPQYLHDFLSVKYAIPQTANNRVLDIFTHDQIYNQYSDAIVTGYCNPYANFTGTIWAGSYFLPYNEERQKIENGLITDTNGGVSDKTLGMVRHYSQTKHKPVAIVNGGGCPEYYNLNALGLNSNTKIINVDGSVRP